VTACGMASTWTGGLDDDMTEGLFSALSDQLVDGEPVSVLLDKRHLEDGSKLLALALTL
jgi:hypothetical protein